MNVYGLQMKFILYNKTVYSNFLLHEEFDIAHKITISAKNLKKPSAACTEESSKIHNSIFNNKKDFVKTLGHIL